MNGTMEILTRKSSELHMILTLVVPPRAADARPPDVGGVKMVCNADPPDTVLSLACRRRNVFMVEPMQTDMHRSPDGDLSKGHRVWIWEMAFA